MLVIFHVVVTEHSNQIRVIRFIGIQIELCASLPALFHALRYKMLKQRFLVCAKLRRQIRVTIEVVLIVVHCLILGKLLDERRVLEGHATVYGAYASNRL